MDPLASAVNKGLRLLEKEVGRLAIENAELKARVEAIERQFLSRDTPVDLHWVDNPNAKVDKP